ACRNGCRGASGRCRDTRWSPRAARTMPSVSWCTARWPMPTCAAKAKPARAGPRNRPRPSACWRWSARRGRRKAGRADRLRFAPVPAHRPAGSAHYNHCMPPAPPDLPPDVAHRAGHVAIIGRPNVGKSTLVNALVGAKVSITSNRPQTTRHRLLGIATFPRGQLVLVDTPGIHREQGKLGATAMHRWMNRAARGALEGVDAAALVVEAGRWDDEDGLAYDALRQAGVPVVLVVNQVDRVREK